MSKEFDIIIWGATGFTGRLVAEYIFKNYSSGKLNWAIAGRDKKKLINVRDKIADENIPLIIADSFDEVSLTKMTQRTKVICSTVGPYSKYGSLLVKSCIKTNTHYCDLAGEAQWIRSEGRRRLEVPGGGASREERQEDALLSGIARVRVPDPPI